VVSDSLATVEPNLTPRLQERRSPVLRYAGFDQTGDVRAYLFQRVVIGEKNKLIVVAAEISLFVKHHVRIQDGPALCLHVLTLELESHELSEVVALRRALTENDVVAYLASRPQPAPAKGKRDAPPHDAPPQ
jgi:hypothetical protein